MFVAFFLEESVLFGEIADKSEAREDVIRVSTVGRDSVGMSEASAVQ